jgi:hypothetical protein
LSYARAAFEPLNELKQRFFALHYCPFVTDAPHFPSRFEIAWSSKPAPPLMAVRGVQCGDSEIRHLTMEIAMRVSESEAALGKFSFPSVLIEPEVRSALDPIWRRTSASGH